MRTLLSLAASLWISLTAIAQPFTPSELGWPGSIDREIAPLAFTATWMVWDDGIILTNQIFGTNAYSPYYFWAPVVNTTNGFLTLLDKGTNNAGTVSYEFTNHSTLPTTDYFTFAVSNTPSKLGKFAVTNINILVNSTNATNVATAFCSAPAKVIFIKQPPTPIGEAAFWTVYSVDACGGAFTNTYVHTPFSPSFWTPTNNIVGNAVGFLMECGNPFSVCTYFTISNTVADCANPANAAYSFAANGGTYTVTTNQNYFILDGYSPTVSSCSPPAASQLSFTICNTNSTTKNLIMFGVMDYGTIGGCGPPNVGIAANLNVNGSHFTFLTPGVTEILDCDTGLTCGSIGAGVISNAIPVAGNSSLTINVNTRVYQINGNPTPHFQRLSVTNFWQ